MKNIGISIDEATLEALAALSRWKGAVARGRQPSRSVLIRQALHDFVARQERLRREASERPILARRRKQLALDAGALVREQAEP